MTGSVTRFFWESGKTRIQTKPARTAFYQTEKTRRSGEDFSRKNIFPGNIRTLKNAGDLNDRTKSSCLLQPHQKSRLYSSIVGLLLSLIATRADDLPVIDDSEAFQVRRQSRRGARLSHRCPDQPPRHLIYQFRTKSTPIRRSLCTLLARKKA